MEHKALPHFPLFSNPTPKYCVSILISFTFPHCCLSLPVPLTSLLFRQHSKHASASGTLHLKFPQPGILSSQMSTWFTPSSPLLNWWLLLRTSQWSLPFHPHLKLSSTQHSLCSLSLIFLHSTFHYLTYFFLFKKTFYFILEYSWLTALYWFQVYSKSDSVIQIGVSIYLHYFPI